MLFTFGSISFDFLVIKDTQIWKLSSLKLRNLKIIVILIRVYICNQQYACHCDDFDFQKKVRTNLDWRQAQNNFMKLDC